VFHIPGYDPVSPQEFQNRFIRQLGYFKRTWDIEAEAVVAKAAAGFPAWKVEASGPNWRAVTDFELLAWDDLIQQDSERSQLSRLGRSVRSYADLIATGTLLRYASANRRYFGFSILPLLHLLLVLGLALGFAAALRFWLELPPLEEIVLASAGGVALFLLMLRWPGWRLSQALDDWCFSLEYIYGTRHDIDERVQQFARRIAQCARDGAHDEILVVGHSLGATLAVDALARALEIDPQPGRRNTAISLVTCGATIPKCVLHPAARRLRDQARRLADDPTVFWAEHQAREDSISFYLFDPVAMRLIAKERDRLDAKPLIRRVHVRDMLQPETFARYRLRPLRLHYQCVSANDRRAVYDYFMMTCGPLRAPQWAGAPGGFLDYFPDPQTGTLGD
jgi:pimeloyl-ACP methyl ester carboxylesterase